MIEQNPNPSASSIGLGDVLFTIFRHKWKIIAFVILGALAAGALLTVSKPDYTSNAKLLIRYVTETRGPDTAGQSEIVREPDQRGATIINSEMEILSSSDALLGAAKIVGPARILAPYGGGTNEVAAAGVLAKGLKVENARNTSVISVSLTHRDPVVAQSALRALRDQYLERHEKFHRSGDSYAALEAQTEAARAQLNAVEKDLQTRKNQLNVTSVEAAKEDYLEQLSSIRKLIFETEARLAEQQAVLALHRPGAISETNIVETNALAQSNVETNKPASVALDTQTVATYRRLSLQLERLKMRELELQQTFSDENRILKRTREEIASLENKIIELGISPAALAALEAAPQNAVPSAAPLYNLAELEAGIRSAAARLDSLRKQEELVVEEIRKINSAEGYILAKERDKALTEDLYLYFSKGLERAKIDKNIADRQRNNIRVIQEPTFGAAASIEQYKKAGIVFASLAGVGFAWAFALDLLFNPAFIRRKQVETLLRVPVFASVPDFGRNGRSRLRAKRKQLRSGSVEVIKNQDGRAEIAPWDEQDPMLAHYEAIRDRLVMSYDDDTHKPKVVGLTSDHHGAGVTRLATGVAAALSRDVERKVLLIALAKSKVAVSAFEKGRPAVDFGSRESWQSVANGTEHHSDERMREDYNFVSENLHSLAKTGRNVAGASVVQSFCDLIPKLRAADYDYIIFDLPPLSETSGSIRLASQMERTLLVVEAEKSSKDQLQRARSLLGDSKTVMAAIFNRGRNVGLKSLDS